MLETSKLLYIHQVSQSYDTIAALDNITFTLGQREFFSLVGPSGAGKSTLLRILAGIESPDKGAIQFCEDWRSEEKPVLVFQDFWLFPGMTIEGNIGFGLRARKTETQEIRRRVAELIADFGLKGKEKMLPSRLSAGQQQRVALARALAIRPRLLLLDEPFAHLDRELKGETAAYLRWVHDEYELTTLAVTHDQDEALAMSDRIGFLSRGRLKQIGCPQDLISQPVDEETASFFGPLNRISKDLVCRPQDLEICVIDSLDTAQHPLTGHIRKVTIQTRGVLYTVQVSDTSHLVFAPGPALPLNTPVSLTLRSHTAVQKSPKERTYI